MTRPAYTNPFVICKTNLLQEKKKIKHIICRLRVGPYGEKLWRRAWKCCPRPATSGLKMLPSACDLGQHFQDPGHSFSLYGPPSRQIAYVSFWTNIVSFSRLTFHYFFSQEGTVTNPVIWLVLSAGPDFPISDHCHRNAGKWCGRLVVLVNFREWTVAVMVSVCPFYTSIDDLSTQVYLYWPLNGKESHCT